MPRGRGDPRTPRFTWPPPNIKNRFRRQSHARTPGSSVMYATCYAIRSDWAC
jgi:hypothetical protein